MMAKMMSVELSLSCNWHGNVYIISNIISAKIKSDTHNAPDGASHYRLIGIEDVVAVSSLDHQYNKSRDPSKEHCKELQILREERL